MIDDAHLPPGYPVRYEADVVLRDGSTAHVRPIRPADMEALQAFHLGQSERSIYFRFFTQMARLSDEDLYRFTHVDYRRRMALVALRGHAIIGIGRWDVIPDDDASAVAEAEVAFNISDHYQGMGIGSVLLEHLAAAAREQGLRRFSAEVLPSNGKMLAVFREAGYATDQHMDEDVVLVTLDLDPTEQSRDVVIDREHRSEAASIAGLLGTRAVLIVVDDRDLDAANPAAPSETDQELPVWAGALRRLVAHVSESDELTVDIIGVDEDRLRAMLDDLPQRSAHHPGAQFQLWDGLDEITTPLGLVVLIAGAQRVVELAEEVVTRHPRALVVFSEEFSNTGQAGMDLQQELVTLARAHGTRVLGPGSAGLVAYADSARSPLNLSLFSPVPGRGTIGVYGQSAPGTVNVTRALAARGLGVSAVFSAGNRADVSSNDVMQFWAQDDATAIVALSLESIGNPRKFSRVARRLAAVKPVIVRAAGVSSHVQIRGHAVAATGLPRHVLQAMFRQSGLIEASTVREMLNLAEFLERQPSPLGRRVAVIASAAALADVGVEALTAAGWNAADAAYVVAEGTGGQRARETVAAAYRGGPGGPPDAVVILDGPVLSEYSEPLLHAVARESATSRIPTLAVVRGGRDIIADLPTTVSMPEAVAVLTKVADYAAWRAQDHGEWLNIDGLRRREARELVASHAAGPLSPEAAARLLACYGIQVHPAISVDSAAAAVAAATSLGWPVALKSAAPMLRHRADLGGVRLGIASAEELELAYATMAAHVKTFGASGEYPLQVQTMAPTGVACDIRSREDPLYGPVVSFGISGDASELLDDIRYGVPPLRTADVRSMVRGIRALPRLTGQRGLPAVDLRALDDVVARLSLLADDLPRVTEVVLRPVVASQHGAAVLSAEVSVGDADRGDGFRRVMFGSGKPAL